MRTGADAPSPTARRTRGGPKPVKGVVFDLLERTIVAEHGEDAWDDLLATTGLPGPYTWLGSYPNGQFRRPVAEAAAPFGMSPQTVIRWFGRKPCPFLAASIPDSFPPTTP